MALSPHKSVLPVTILCDQSSGRLTQAVVTHHWPCRVCLLTSRDANRPAADQFRLGKAVIHSLAGSNCACVADRHEIAKQVAEIASDDSIDRALIECDSASDPIAFASLFLQHDGGEDNLSELARLNAVVAAVSPQTLLNKLVDGSEGNHAISTCNLMEQIEFADIIMVEGAQPETTLRLSEAIVSVLNPRATLINRTEAVLAELRQSERQFDFKCAIRDTWWRKMLEEACPTGRRFEQVSALVYRARRPFRPERLWNLLQCGLPGVIRAKGFFWLPTRMGVVGGLSIAGRERRFSPAGQWWAATAHRHEKEQSEIPEALKKEWVEPYGDRRQAISFVVIEADPADTVARLNQCLLTDSEMEAGEQVWAGMADPFPKWIASPHQHENHRCCKHR
jgi:G3E family GTPase